jgi:hypothetical protein
VAKLKSLKRKLAVIDAETDPFLFNRIPEAFVWDVYDGEQHYEFEHVSDALAFLENGRYLVYAHNGGKFDYLLPGFLDEINEFDKVLKINGRLAKFSIGESEFRDSYSILPIPLRDFDKGEIDYAKMEKSVRHLHMDEIRTYLRRDTESLYKLVSAFREQYGDGITLAGSAMKFWQKQSRQRAPKSTKGFYNAIAPFYHGGRVEAYHIGMIDEPFTMVDINSAYPFAMMSEHPIDTHYFRREYVKGEEIKGYYFYTIRCISRGAFARHVKGRGLEFPESKERELYYVSGWELSAGLRNGLIRDYKIESVLEFKKTINFSQYILFFYSLKKSAKKGTPEYIFAKLFMNSLYGKFGANPSNYRNYTLAKPEFVEAMMKDGYEFDSELGPWAVMTSPLDESEERYYNVATAASITGYVRSMLLEAMCRIRETGGTVLYCDTDSIVFKGGKPPTFDKELGGWSCDGNFVRGGIAGKKLYAFYGPQVSDGKPGFKTACKGVRISPEEILRVAAGEEVTYEQQAPVLKGKGKVAWIRRRVNRKGNKPSKKA